MRAVLDGLDSAGIGYCHWKSNEHLLAGLNGATDLDLLICSDAASAFDEIVRCQRYVEVRNPKLRRIPGLTDYLGMDDETGVMSHLHVHYRLILGERHVKEHHLPLESWLLRHRVHRHGVAIPAPAHELLLLYLRTVLKSDALTAVRARASGSHQVIPGGIRVELHGLLEQVTAMQAETALGESGLPLDQSRFAEFRRRAARDELTGGYLVSEKHDLLRRLRAYERHPRLHATVRRLGYRIRFDARVQQQWPVRRKTLCGSGIYVAVVGADGSGKSRLVVDLTEWLGRKLQTSTVYFGQPKRDRRLIALRRTAKVLRRQDKLQSSAAAFEAAAWVYIARKRDRTDRRARSRRAASEVVIAERFPLPDFAAMETPMDGPRLMRRTSVLGRWMRRVEDSCYQRIGRPDLTIALRAPLSTLRARKPQTDPVEHQAKHDGVAMLTDGRTLSVIDAEQSYDDVLMQARRRIWDLIVDSEPRTARSSP